MGKLLGWTAWTGVLALVALATAGAWADEKKPDGKIKVLIIDGQNNHNWKATTPHLKKVLEDSGRFTVDVATSPAKVNARIMLRSMAILLLERDSA